MKHFIQLVWAAAALAVLAACSDGSDSPPPQAEAEEEERIGFEILEIQSPTSIRAWISPEISFEEFEALEVPPGWRKNQPRESAACGPSGGRFPRSPDTTREEGVLIEEHFGFNWFHSATVIEANVPLDEDGLLLGATVRKFHEVDYAAGSCMVLLISPDEDIYFRIGRDAQRVNDQPSIPNLWRLEEYTVPEDIVIKLFGNTRVIRTDNQDSFQGPVELPGL